ncbi:MAG: 50S ribosomal protein L5 [Patescibacteria group bacterium]|nr:50S ribosomal protein L5 [Patescibacteria group bacterium]
MKTITLKEKYNKEIIPQMKKEFGFKNNLAVPKLEKIVLNVGAGRMSQQPNFQDKLLPELEKEIALISGQKPKLTMSKKSISGFKVRQGQIIGLKTTIRGNRMYDFLDKIIKIVFPRVKDFKGIDLKNIDKTGNLSVGFKENMVFSEINPESSKVDFGLEITIVVNTVNRNEAIELYRLLGMPLKKS